MGGAWPGRVGEAGRVGDQRDDGAVGGGVEDSVAAGSERAADRSAGVVSPDGRAALESEGEDVAGEGADVDEVARAVARRGGGLVGERDRPADGAVGPQGDCAAGVGGKDGGAGGGGGGAGKR